MDPEVKQAAQKARDLHIDIMAMLAKTECDDHTVLAALIASLQSVSECAGFSIEQMKAMMDHGVVAFGSDASPDKPLPPPGKPSDSPALSRAMDSLTELAVRQNLVIVASLCSAKQPKEEDGLTIMCGAASPSDDKIRQRMASKCIETFIRKFEPVASKSRDDKVTEELLKP